MSTTVTYKGQTLTTAENQTRVLKTSGKYMEDDVTIVDVTSGGGGALKMGVIRPDAELVKKWTYDKLLVDDEDVTIPAYSSTAQTLIASSNLETVQLSLSQYNYYMTQRVLVNPVYDPNFVRVAGAPEYTELVYAGELRHTPADYFESLDGSKSYGSANAAWVPVGNIGLEVYWTSSSAVNLYSNSTYGCSGTLTAPTVAVSSGQTVIKSPAWTMRGHTSYFTQAAWDAVDDIRAQYVIELWRVPKDPTKIDGWAMKSMLDSIRNDIANNNGKLR